MLEPVGYTMQAPRHVRDRPDGSIPIPDKAREAELLSMLLEAGLYPKCAPAGEQGGSSEAALDEH